MSAAVGVPCRARAALIAPAMILLAAAPATAAGVWDLFGSVGVNVGRADNPRFLGTVNANYDPNNAICALPPSDPNYDEKICEASTVSSTARRADYTGTLRLSGGLSGTWPSTHFEMVYAPYQSFYYERQHLNTLSHDFASSFRHGFSARTTLTLDEDFNYTPEQGADPNIQQRQNSVIVNYSSHTTNNLRGALAFQSSAATTLTWTYHNFLRAFSSSDLVDSDEHGLSFQWRRRAGGRSYFTSGYQIGAFLFSGQEEVPSASDPNILVSRPRPDSMRHTVNVGYGLDTAGGFNMMLTTGYNTLRSDDPNQETSNGIYVNSSLGFTGSRAATSAGYNRGFSDGGGVFATALTQNVYATGRLTLSKSIAADLYAVRSANERLHGGTGGGQTVRSFNGRSTLTYSIGRNLGLNASYTYYRQGTTGASGSIPDIRSNHYSVGMTWSFR